MENYYTVASHGLPGGACSGGGPPRGRGVVSLGEAEFRALVPLRSFYGMAGGNEASPPPSRLEGSGTFRVAAYNILSCSEVGIMSGSSVMEQIGVDMAAFQETKVTNGIYPSNKQLEKRGGKRVVATVDDDLFAAKHTVV